MRNIEPCESPAVIIMIIGKSGSPIHYCFMAMRPDKSGKAGIFLDDIIIVYSYRTVRLQ